jgi:potassium efflux system protein
VGPGPRSAGCGTPTPSRLPWASGWLLAWLLAAPIPVPAQTPLAPGGPSLGLAEVEASLQEAQQAEGRSADEKTRVLSAYREAKSLLEGARIHAEAAAAFRAAGETAPAQTEETARRLSGTGRGPPAAEGLAVSESTPIPELTRRLTREEGELASLASTLRGLEEEVQVQVRRPAQLREELAEVRRAAGALTEALAEAAPQDQPPAVARASRVLAQARLQAKTAELARLEQELVTHGVRLGLAESRRDLAARELAVARERVGLLRRLVVESRLREGAGTAERTAAAARSAADKHPVVREAAEENVSIGRRIADLAGELERAVAVTASTEERARRVEADFRRIRQRVELAGVSTAVARLLMQERRGLHARTDVPRDERVGGKEIASVVALEALDVEERRRALVDVQELADDGMEQVEPTMPPTDRQAVHRDLVTVLTERRVLLEKLDGELAAYVEVLGELDFARARLASASRAYATYLDGHLLWIPSTYPITEASLENLRRGAAWLIQSVHWQGTQVALASDLQSHPLAWVLAGLVVLGLALLVGPVRRRLKVIAERVRDPATDGFSLTLAALGLHAVHVLPVPLALGLLGWRLESALEATDFTERLGDGATMAARLLFGGRFLLSLCQPWGVGGAHFRWPESVLAFARRQLRLLLGLGLPAALVAFSVGRFADETYAVSVGRSAFMAGMALTAYVFARLLSPRGPLVRPHRSTRPSRRLAQLWPLWYPVAVGAPLALAGLAAWGYYHTASELVPPATRTVHLVLGAVLLYGLGLRWLALGRRQVALKLAREKQEATAAMRAGADSVRGQLPLSSPAADLAAIDAQTRQVFHLILLLGGPVLLWAIWAPALPAFDLFTGVTLWHYTETLNGQATSVPITLGSVALALLIGGVAGAAARSLPGVLELALLRHLSLTRGSRYAIKTLLQYTIATIGTLVAFGTLGLSWSQVQWLVAALGVGLGFGLQEIVANFISGIIILFERPVRVGDLVTVGNLTGTVSDISIRATTITDFDRREILVPNKSFITTDVVNWSLTDPITRIKVLVGIAYGSDVRKAQRVMIETVRSLPLVRSDPEPRVWFVGFGPSSLDFEVHAFAGELADRMPLTHAVHMALEEALRENGIEIAFPQQDLHLRTVSPQASAALGGGVPADPDRPLP